MNFRVLPGRESHSGHGLQLDPATNKSNGGKKRCQFK
jgi:hypothetical protein